MEIKGKIYCLFEQSGCFKNEFKKLGYEAYDADIQNNFGQTDFQIDLFEEIEKAYEGGEVCLTNLPPMIFFSHSFLVFISLPTTAISSTVHG